MSKQQSAETTGRYIVEKLIPRGYTFHAEDDGQILAEVYFDEVARLFEHALEMLAVCKMVIEAERQANDELNYTMMVDALEAAERVVEKIEGESCE